MNQIARRTRLAEPVISPRLTYDLDRVLKPHPDVGAPRRFAASVRIEAAEAARVLEALCEPVTSNAMRDWIRPIGAAVRNPPSGEDFAAWCAAFAIACGDFAAGAFSASTQRQALQQFQFFPSVADVTAIVAPKSLALRSKLRALRLIADATDPDEEGRKTPSDDERAAVSATVAKVSGGVFRSTSTQEPIRTVEQQLAILRGDAA